jgi:hypothetical protein
VRRGRGARRFAVVVALGLAAATTARASGSAEGDPRSVFPRRARVTAATDASATVARVLLPPTVLAESRPDLADLRLIDDAGHFVPFAVVPPVDPGASGAIACAAPVVLTAVDRAADDDGHPRRERLELAVEPAGFAFDRITFDLAAGELLVARATVWELVDGGMGRELVRNAPLFRLPGREGSRGPAVHEGSITVPLGEWPRVAIEIRIEQGGWVAPVEVRVERDERAEQATGEVPLEVVDTRIDDRSTQLELARPAGIVPTALRIESASEAFLRDVRVRDVSGARLGHGVIARAGDGKLVASTVELERRPVATGDLYVDIDDAGEGPLDELRVVAQVGLPTVLFIPPPGGVTDLHWGGGRVTTASHRDLDSFARIAAPGSSAADDGGAPWWRALPVAALGPAEDNPRHQSEQAMAFAQRAGAPLEPRGWALLRELTVGPTPEGLAEWTLDAGDVAAARADLADVRIVDTKDRQLAYLIDDSATQPVEPALTPLAPHGDASRWLLALPDGAAPVAAVTIDFEEGFVARQARILGGPGRDEPVLAAPRLERRAGGTPFRVALAGSPRLAALVIEVENGDDLPLTPRSPSIDVERRRVLFPASPGKYRGLLGNPSAEAPRYELASVRELALGLATSAAEPGPRGPNPAYRPPAPWSGRRAGTVALWIALGIAVVVLVGLTLKLVRDPASRS